MHPEGVQLLCVGEEGVRPLQGRGVGEACRSPGALRRADECDPFRVEDGGEADANKASEGSSDRGGPRTFNANVGGRGEKGKATDTRNPFSSPLSSTGKRKSRPTRTATRLRAKRCGEARANG